MCSRFFRDLSKRQNLLVSFQEKTPLKLRRLLFNAHYQPVLTELGIYFSFAVLD